MNELHHENAPVVGASVFLAVYEGIELSTSNCGLVCRARSHRANPDVSQVLLQLRGKELSVQPAGDAQKQYGT